MLVATTMILTSCNKEYDITVMPNDTQMGTTSGSGTYLKGTIIEISALPKSGYNFVKWDDGNTNNPRRITVNKNETYTAIFKNDTEIPALNNFVIIDGVEKQIMNVQMDESDFYEDLYDIYIFLSGNEEVNIMADKANHEGRIIDLTEKEATHDGWYWVVDYERSGNRIFETFGSPLSSDYPVFMSGTLYVKQHGTSNGKPVFEIRIENGKVKGEGSYGDGLVHTIELHYKGEMGFNEF